MFVMREFPSKAGLNLMSKISYELSCVNVILKDDFNIFKSEAFIQIIPCDIF